VPAARMPQQQENPQRKSQQQQQQLHACWAFTAPDQTSDRYYHPQVYNISGMHMRRCTIIILHWRLYQRQNLT
jgi:hypothetical protein